MSDETTLLPCPFCGCVAMTLLKGHVIDMRYSVGCQDDECRGFIGLSWLYKTEAEAIAAWNTRAERTCECDGTISWEWTGPTTYYEHELSCGHVITSVDNEPPNYCEECGAKVVNP